MCSIKPALNDWQSLRPMEQSASSRKKVLRGFHGAAF